MTAKFSSGILQLTGDANQDWISVNVSGSYAYFNGTQISNQTGKPQLAIPLTELKRIDIGGRDGTDTIDFAQSSTFMGPVRTFGEGGDDLFRIRLSTIRTANIAADGGTGRDTCDVPDLANRTGTFWTNAELGAINTYAGWNLNKATRVTPFITSDTTNRSTDLLMRVIRQFNVVSNPRYTAVGTTTYCNIFSWDVTSALGAEIPHWIDANGNPASANTPNAKELTANATVGWLANHGSRFGWTKVTAAQAQASANLGKPAIAIWKNPTGAPGHVAIVRPDTTQLMWPAAPPSRRPAGPTRSSRT